MSIMAENKKSFILYADLIFTLEELDDNESGKLFKHILRYVNDQNPEAPDKITKISFEPIKQQLKRDLKDWENKRHERSASGREGGLKSAEARRSKSKQTKANPSTASKIEANQAVNVTVTANVNDTVTVTETHKKENLIDIFFKDLENSSHLTVIAMKNSVSVEKIKDMIPGFKKSADLMYPDFNRFMNHFKNWAAIEINKQKPNISKIEKGIKDIEDAQPLLKQIFKNE